jgi:hypothetical protein
MCINNKYLKKIYCLIILTTTTVPEFIHLLKCTFYYIKKKEKKYKLYKKRKLSFKNKNGDYSFFFLFIYKQINDNDKPL